jgi:MFS family permease
MEASADESVLHHRAFQMFWAARVFAALSLQMQTVAVGWQVYELTGSAFKLGLVGLVQFVPAVVLVLLAGSLADRYDRRRIAWLAQSVEAIAGAVLTVGTFGGWLTPNLILAMVFIIGAARAFEQPSVQTLLPNIVSAALLPRAVAASSSATQAAHIIGPAIGGIFYALSPTLVYAACSVLWIAAGLLIVRVHIERRTPSREPPSWAMFFGGIAFIRRNPIVLGAISLDLFAVLLGGATALLPIYAKDIFETGPWGLGLLRAAPAVGALTMSVVLSHSPIARGVGRAMFLTVAVFGIATIVFAISRSFWLSMLALVVLGAADLVSVVIRLTLVQLHTPDEMRGRVFAVNSLFVGTSNQLGEFRAGVMAAWLGAVPAVLIGGVGTLLVVLVAIKAFPALYRADQYADSRITLRA